MTLKAFKAAIKPGTALEVLDHWQPRYHNTTRHVVKVQGDGFYFTMGGRPERCWSPFPSAKELRFVDGVAHVMFKDNPRRSPRFWVLKVLPVPPHTKERWNMNRRTRIFVSTDNAAANYVTVRAANLITGEIEETEYFAPSGGGYVKINNGKGFPQVCDGLCSTGNTLSWSAKTPFIDLIRREYRAGRKRTIRSIEGS